MKIALVTETFPPEINGVAMTFGVIARELGRRGHQITVYRPRRPDLINHGVHPEYTEVPMPGMPIPGYSMLRLGLPAAGRLRKTWSADRPDLVHVATEGPLGSSAITAAKSLGIPVTSSFHTNFHAYTKHYGFGPLHSFALWWLRRVHNRTARTFAPTKELCAELAELGFRDLALLSRGVDTWQFNPARRSAELRQKWGAAPNDPVVLHTGRMAAEKNYPLLFRAFAAMRAAEPRCRFVLVGDGPLRARLQKDNPDYIFTGFIPREELAVHYASADIYIHASLTETFGNVLTEALGSGLAAAGFDYAAARLFVRHEENGLSVPCDDPEGLIACAVRLATDVPLRERLRKAARVTVEAQSWETVIGRFEADLMAVAGVHPHTPTALPVGSVPGVAVTLPAATVIAATVAPAPANVSAATPPAAHAPVSLSTPTTAIPSAPSSPGLPFSAPASPAAKPQSKPRILILTAGYGEGHNAAARALAAACDTAYGPGTGRLVDLFALASPRINAITRRMYLAMINGAPHAWSAVYAWADRSSFAPRLLWLLRAETALLEATIDRESPTVICSTYPVYGFLLQYIAQKRPVAVPFYNIVTDSISINSLWWRAPCTGWFLPNEDSANVLRRAGVEAERLHVSGFPVTPFFSSHAAEFSPPDLMSDAAPRVLYIINSGTKNAAETAQQLLAETGWEITCAVGRDEGLRKQLERLAAGRKRTAHILGWTDQIPRLLMTHHVVVSKAGGATTQEAIAARCPMIVNQVVPGQEEGNYELLRRHNVGGLAETPEAVIAALRRAFANRGQVWSQWRTSLADLARPEAARDIAHFVVAHAEATEPVPLPLRSPALPASPEFVTNPL